MDNLIIVRSNNQIILDDFGINDQFEIFQIKAVIEINDNESCKDDR
jgi:hypothetical protein